MADFRLASQLSHADFLTIKKSFAIPAELTDSTSVFLEKIGLNSQSYSHQMLFRKMMNESREAHEKFSDRLHPSRVDDAFDQAAVSIYQSASAATRSLYELFGSKESSWVTRWLLWRAINHPESNAVDLPEPSPQAVYVKQEDVSEWASRGNAVRDSASPGRYWDPVRDG